MKRRSRLMVAAMAGMSLITAACGGGSDGDAQETPEASAPAVTEAAPTEETEPAVAETDPPVEETDPPVAETEAAEELTASEVGITEDTIRIGVTIADLAPIRAAGISIPETLTSEHLFDRWQMFADQYNDAGGINGRQIELVQMMWNPLDPATFDAVCAQATIDEEVAVLVNGTGLSAIAMECIIDGGVPVYYGDVVPQDLLDTGMMISMAPSGEVVAAAGARQWLASTDVAPGSKIGVLASNSPLISAAGAAAAAVLEEGGYEVEVIEVNSLSGDNAAINGETAAAAGTFAANGVVHAFVATPFTENKGFWTSAAGSLPYTMLDTASSQCSVFGLSRAPIEAANSECVTAFDHPTSESGGLRADTEFEAACREMYDARYTDYFGGPSNAGVPSGAILTDSAGTKLISDYPPQECTIMNVLQMALTNAGLNPTRQDIIDATLALGEIDMANASNGKGTLSPDKPYMADSVHTIRIVAADPTVAPDGDGLYNGCAAPVNCGIVIDDWTSING